MNVTREAFLLSQKVLSEKKKTHRNTNRPGFHSESKMLLFTVIADPSEVNKYSN